MLFLLFLTPQLIEPFLLGQFLLAAYYFALGFILLIAKLERLLRFCAAAAFCKRSANAAPELFRIFRYLPDVNRCRRAEMQCIVVLQNKFEHFSVLRLAAEGYFAAESIFSIVISNTPTQNGSSKYTVRLLRVLHISPPPSQKPTIYYTSVSTECQYAVFAAGCQSSQYSKIGAERIPVGCS